jgi:hypothetical protein
MTTIIDPGTSGEVAFFNKSGTAILNVTLDAGGSETVAAVAGRVFVIGKCLSPTSDHTQTINLSSDFQPGDEFWLFPQTRFWAVVDENGNTLSSNTSSISIGFIKVVNGTSPPTWMPLSLL